MLLPATPDFATPARMDGLQEDTELIRSIAEFTSLSPAALAREVGVAKTTINRPYNGSATTRLSGPTIQKLRDRFPDWPGWSNIKEERMPFRHVASDASDSDSLEIPILEMAYGLGGTFLDDISEEAKVERFPKAFVRLFTQAPADQLAFARGIGDSMEPTIGDRDLLLIDRSIDSIRLNDQIWALASGGIGMVKRVRVTGDQVILLSDNNQVPDLTVDQEDLFVIGRVVTIMKSV